MAKASSDGSQPKTAFVFAGGGSFGAVQVGMLHSLVAHGITADMAVGSSVGAMNSAYYAGTPTSEGVERLARIWRDLRRRDVFPITPRVLLGLMRRRDFLLGSGGLYQLARAWRTRPDNTQKRKLEVSEPHTPRAFRGEGPALLINPDHIGITKRILPRRFVGALISPRHSAPGKPINLLHRLEFLGRRALLNRVRTVARSCVNGICVTQIVLKALWALQAGLTSCNKIICACVMGLLLWQRFVQVPSPLETRPKEACQFVADFRVLRGRLVGARREPENSRLGS